MDRSVPAAAAAILTFIYRGESGGDYNKLSGGAERRSGIKVTNYTIEKLLNEPLLTTAAGRKKVGAISSAAGAPQIIQKTLKALVYRLGLKGTEKFDANMQDRLAYDLLRQRGYDAWVSGRIDTVEFAKRLAQEWASLPVLAGTKNYKGVNIKRGTSYYAGDGLNSANHVSVTEFEHVLNDALGNKQVAVMVKPADTKPVATTKYAAAVGTGVAVIGGAKQASETITDWQPVIDMAITVSKYGPWVAGAIVAAIGVVVIARKVWK